MPGLVRNLIEVVKVDCKSRSAKCRLINCFNTIETYLYSYPKVNIPSP